MTIGSNLKIEYCFSCRHMELLSQIFEKCADCGMTYCFECFSDSDKHKGCNQISSPTVVQPPIDFKQVLNELRRDESDEMYMNSPHQNDNGQFFSFD